MKTEREKLLEQLADSMKEIIVDFQYSHEMIATLLVYTIDELDRKGVEAPAALEIAMEHCERILTVDVERL